MLADIYRVPRLGRSFTLHLCFTRERFSFVCKSTKMCAISCVHVICVFFLVGTVHTSIKFKSSCMFSMHAYIFVYTYAEMIIIVRHRPNIRPNSKRCRLLSTWLGIFTAGADLEGRD